MQSLIAKADVVAATNGAEKVLLKICTLIISYKKTKVKTCLLSP